MRFPRLNASYLLIGVPVAVAWACGDETAAGPIASPPIVSPPMEGGIDARVPLDATGTGAIEAGLPPIDCSPYAGLQDCALKVTTEASADASGLSWDDPLELQAALDRVSCGCEVWIAEGSYLPTRPALDDDVRTRSFHLQPNAHVLGGFAGDEISVEQRDPEQHRTILSGDLGQPIVREDNAYHVVVGAPRAVLDGLTIRDGQADGFKDGQIVGAGLFNLGASVTLRNVHVTDNLAGTGAGIYNDSTSHPELYDCVIARNIADTGGGLYLGGTSNAHLERTVFSENVAIFIGGGIALGAGILELSDSRFIGNRGDFGGGVALSGGTAQIERCWFEGNWAGLFGGAAIIRDGASANLASSVLFGNSSVGHGASFVVWTAALQMSGVTVAGGSAAFGGIVLIKDQSQVTINDSLLWGNTDNAGELFRTEGTGNTLSISNSVLQPSTGAPTSDAGIFNADPLFTNTPTQTRYSERAGLPSELRLANSSEFMVGDRLELGDDGVERTVTIVGEQTVTFTPPLSMNTPRFLRVDSWSADAPSLDLDLHLSPTSPAIDRGSAAAPAMDFYGQTRVDVPGVGNDCGDAGCGAADLGGIETIP